MKALTTTITSVGHYNILYVEHPAEVDRQPVWTRSSIIDMCTRSVVEARICISIDGQRCHVCLAFAFIADIRRTLCSVHIQSNIESP